MQINKHFFLISSPLLLLGLSQQPLFSKKDAKSNNAVVDIACLTMEKGGNVSSKWLDPLLYNSVSRIHENGVVELRFPNGFRSWSVAGKEPKTRFKQAGAIFPKRGWIKEDVGDTSIYHIQTEPSMLERIKLTIHKYWPIYFEWIERPHLEEFDQLDKFILDMILSGNAQELQIALNDYPHKVTADISRGRTVYLRLDNTLKSGISILRCKGVIPSRNWFGFSTHMSHGRAIRMVGNVPMMYATVDRKSPSGAMSLSDAKNEYAASFHFVGDEGIGIGKYNVRHMGKNTGFVVYGMTDADYRIVWDGGTLFWKDGVTNNVIEIGSAGPSFFRGIGGLLGQAHSMGVVHRKLMFENIGFVMNGKEKYPVFKDLEKSFRLELGASPYHRAGWMFNDVYIMIQQLTMDHHPLIDKEIYVRKFLEGYFGGYVRQEIIDECFDLRLSREMEQLKIKDINIPETFPNLFNAILSKEIFDSTLMDPVGVIERGVSVLIKLHQYN